MGVVGPFVTQTSLQITNVDKPVQLEKTPPRAVLVTAGEGESTI